MRKTRELCFVCSHPVDEVWIRSTLLEISRRQIDSTLYILVSELGQIDHILNVYSNTSLSIKEIRGFGEINYCSDYVIVSPSSGMRKEFFSKQPTKLIHMPHSLASLHVIYPEDCFDDYDILFAAGPHHMAEFQALTKIRGLMNKEIFQVGYGKFDILKDQLDCYRVMRQNQNNRSTILFAPSWGADNLLETCDLGMIEHLIQLDHRVILRPHPAYFIERQSLLKRYQDRFGGTDFFQIENSLTSNTGLLEADILVGDYSGTSFEFYALKKRPIISVDVAKKIENQNWRLYGLEPIEISYREEMGLVVPSASENILEAIDLINRGGYNETKLEISSFIYNSDKRCGIVASEIILGILND